MDEEMKKGLSPDEEYEYRTMDLIDRGKWCVDCDSRIHTAGDGWNEPLEKWCNCPERADQDDEI